MLKQFFFTSKIPLNLVKPSYTCSRTIYYRPNLYNFSQQNKPETPTQQNHGENKASTSHGNQAASHDDQHGHKQGGNVALEYAKEFIRICIEGSKLSWRDFKYAQNLSNKYREEWSITEIREHKRIRLDQLKLIPFSIFVIVPFAETLLPPYLIFFPNAIPSAFQFPHIVGEQKARYIRLQEEGYEALKLKLDVALLESGATLTPGSYDSALQALLANKDKINAKLNIFEQDSETMKKAAGFLRMEFFDGTNIFNQLYKHTVNFPRYIINLFAWIARSNYRAKWDHPIFTHEFKFDFTPFEQLKQTLLKYQLQTHLESLKKQNEAIKKYDLQGVDSTQLIEIARERGINTTNETEIRQRLGDEWVKHNVEILKNEPSLLLWYSVLQYSKTAPKK